MSTLTCSECLKMLFKKDSRCPPIECRQEAALEEMDNMQALTGEYVGHGLWDTLTGVDDGSGV